IHQEIIYITPGVAGISTILVDIVVNIMMNTYGRIVIPPQQHFLILIQVLASKHAEIWIISTCVGLCWRIVIVIFLCLAIRRQRIFIRYLFGSLHGLG